MYIKIKYVCLDLKESARLTYCVYSTPSECNFFNFLLHFDLQVLELLGFQTCIHSCLEFLGQCLGEEKEEKVNGPSKKEKEKVNEDEGEKVNEASDGSVRPSFDKIAHIMEVVLKTSGDGGRREGKSMVLKLLRAYDRLPGDVNSAETCNKYIFSSCQRCLNSLLKLFKQGVVYGGVDDEIILEADNLLWLLDILADRKAAEEFALMWANQQELAKLHKKYVSWIYSRHLVSSITTRLFVCIGKGEILPPKETRQRLLLTWFQPLLDDYSSLRKLESFDPKVVKENIEREILELTPKDQQSIFLAWYECFLKKCDCPDLRKAFESWSRGSFR
ncbi:hypothetical protein MKW92_041667 [Papaver armeniacum]|nr:hypothetical protein MKW92_041667 [Papaver armeniacum]